MRKSLFSPTLPDPFAVEGMRAPGAKGIAPGVVQAETDPDWQPV